MRAIRSCCAALLLLGGMAGCITSVNPLYESAEDLESPAPYFGTWQNERYIVAIEPALGSGLQFFGQGETEQKRERMVRKLARIRVLENPGVGRVLPSHPIPPVTLGYFVAGVVEIEGVHYVDLTVEHFYANAPETAPTVWGHLLPVHSIARIELKDGRLLMTHLNVENFQALLAHRPGAIAHLPNRSVALDHGEDARFDFPVLTASPAELRRFIKDHAKKDVWLHDPWEFEKIDRKVFDEHFRKLTDRLQAAKNSREADTVEPPMPWPARRSSEAAPAAADSGSDDESR